MFGEGERSTCRLAIDPANRTIVFSSADKEREVDLPDSFVGDEFRQFRIVSQDRKASAHLDGILIGELPTTQKIFSASVFGHSGISIEMLRVTEI